MNDDTPITTPMTVTWSGMARIIDCFLKDDTPHEIRTELCKMGAAAEAYQDAFLTDEEVLQELVDRVEVD